MDLLKVANLKATFDQLTPEEKAEAEGNATGIKAQMAVALPALNESDQAAVAWYIAEMLSGLVAVSLGRAGTVVQDSCIAYGVSAIHLLGWGDS